MSVHQIVAVATVLSDEAVCRGADEGVCREVTAPLPTASG